MKIKIDYSTSMHMYVSVFATIDCFQLADSSLFFQFLISDQARISYEVNQKVSNISVKFTDIVMNYSQGSLTLKY